VLKHKYRKVEKVMCKKIEWKYDLDEDQGLAGELEGLFAKGSENILKLEA
jgi:hypothetical protein